MGLGLMGSRMALRLAQAGTPLSVWNRTDGKDEEIVAAGAQRASSAMAVGQAAQIVVCMVTGDEAVDQSILGSSGVAAGMAEGGVIVEMSTTSIVAMEQLASALAHRGIALIDAPVFGSTEAAASGGLVCAAGGERDGLDRVRPLLETICKEVVVVGGAGQGSAVKLAGNLLGAGTISLLAGAIGLVEAAGLGRAQLLDVLGRTSLMSPAAHARASKMVEGDFQPGWPVKHVLKDVTLAQEAGERLGIPLRSAGGVREDYAAAVDAGFGEEDCAAVIKGLQGRDSA